MDEAENVGGGEETEEEIGKKEKEGKEEDI